MFQRTYGVLTAFAVTVVAGCARPAELVEETQDTIAKNLAAVEGHFHSEADDEVEVALELYTDDIVWEAPARGLRFEGKQEVAANYRKMFASMENLELVANLQRFATEDRVVDDTIARVTVTGKDFLPVPLGQRVELRVVHIFEMREGKISREIAYEMWKELE